MTSITKLALALAGTLFLLGCGGAADEADDETVADTTAEVEVGITLDDIAGTWNMRSVPESGDTTATESQLVATSTDVTILLADRDPVLGRTVVAGDSIVVEAGPYESVRRPGTQVWTHAVYRLEGDQLVGTVIAHYETAGADSVLRLHSEGMRAP